MQLSRYELESEWNQEVTVRSARKFTLKFLNFMLDIGSLRVWVTTRQAGGLQY